MQSGLRMLQGGLIKPNELSRVSHVVCLADFDTNYPNLNRIDRIASEINEYLKYKNKYETCIEQSRTE